MRQAIDIIVKGGNRYLDSYSVQLFQFAGRKRGGCHGTLQLIRRALLHVQAGKH